MPVSLSLSLNKTSEYTEPGATPRSQVFNFHKQVSSNYPPERSNSVIKQISAYGKNHTHKSHIHTCKYWKYIYTTEHCCTGTHTQSTNIIKYNIACHASPVAHIHNHPRLYMKITNPLLIQYPPIFPPPLLSSFHMWRKHIPLKTLESPSQPRLLSRAETRGNYPVMSFYVASLRWLITLTLHASTPCYFNLG